MSVLNIDAEVSNLDKVLAFVDEKLESYGCLPKTQMQIDIAVEEIFVNIASYAYHPETGAATFCMEFEKNPNAVLMTFIDSGKPYNPLEADAPDTTLAIEDRNIGGLGIFLVKKNVDEISYEYTDGKNILHMKKFF